MKMIPVAPGFEQQRLSRLRDRGVLDTPADPAYDQVTELVALICECPIAAISLVDEKRQWFKSQVGLNVAQVERNISFCDYVVSTPQKMFLVKDALLDDRFKDSPLVLDGPKIRFYAGVPILTPDGYPLGALCVADKVPRTLRPEQFKALYVLCQQVMLLIESLYSQRAMVQASRMAALGEMAAGIAHEINNPLAIIQGSADLLALEHTGREISELNRTLERISQSAVRIAKIVKSLNSLSWRGSGRQLSICSVESILNHALSISMPRIKASGVDVRIVGDPAIFEICCQPDAISHVLLNLLNNSVDALESRDDRWIEVEVGPSTRSDFVAISVTDSGAGIPAQASGRMLEPFFTTKKSGKGTGLGLCTSKSIIQEHGGEFYWDETSVRTRFCFELPINRNEEKGAKGAA